MKRLSPFLVALLCACGESEPETPDDVPVSVTETEPNNERGGATQLGGSGGYVVTGSCASDSDLDYYAATARAGTLKATLEWAGSAPMRFDPEIGLSGGIVSGTPPLSYSGQATAGAILWAVDCDANGATAGLSYTLRVTVP